MLPLLRTLSYIAGHPLNRSRRPEALRRYLAWQIGSRILPGAVAVPFVGRTRLLIQPGMTGATGNIYCGLHEYEDMALVLHALRPGDRFADVGANVGSYTVIASGAAGAHSLTFEPVPKTFAHLLDNIRLNDIEDLVSAKNTAIGAAEGTVRFTASLGPENHVLANGKPAAEAISVPLSTLDRELADLPVTVMKIDVEGFETEVVNGAGSVLGAPSLLAVIMELNGSGARYGFDESALHARMLEFGFRPARYKPMERAFEPLRERNAIGNTLYARDLEELLERVRNAPHHLVNGRPV